MSDASLFGGQPQGSLAPQPAPLSTAVVEHAPIGDGSEPTGLNPFSGSTLVTSPEIPGLLPLGGSKAN